MNFVNKNFDFSAKNKCIIIGEIGVNHNNSQDILFKLIDEGISAGIDIIKFQIFNASLEISKNARLADYQVNSGFKNNQLDMVKELQLPKEILIKAIKYCKTKNIGILCTPFEHDSVDFMYDELDLKTAKIASSEVTNKPLIKYMAKKFDSLILSTGASSLGEIEDSVRWIKQSSKFDNNDLALLHCTSQYPAPLEDVNLNALLSMKKHFNYPIGYSDHTEGIEIALGAATLGAVIIEKHFTLDKSMHGPDHKASVNISELAKLVEGVKKISKSLGNGRKVISESELEILPKIRKSL